ncbi:hypothetical protein [Bacillus sp. RK1064]|uniref:hypothetical protein n=1 Tax=Bacillus sp. RK1064 TaxID=3447561 RepID=UPI003EDAF294
MRTRGEIEAELLEIYDNIDMIQNDIDDLRDEMGTLFKVVNGLESELSALDQSEGGDE